MNIGIKKNADNAIIPKQANEGDAGFDLFAIEDACVEVGKNKLIKTGLAMAIPSGYVGFVCSRSGLALKKQVFVLNAPGVVDSPYRGDVGVILFNAGDEPFFVKAGDRVAQLLLMKVESVIFDDVCDLDVTIRGDCGFGSTGVGIETGTLKEMAGVSPSLG